MLIEIQTSKLIKIHLMLLYFLSTVVVNRIHYDRHEFMQTALVFHEWHTTNLLWLPLRPAETEQFRLKHTCVTYHFKSQAKSVFRHHDTVLYPTAPSINKSKTTYTAVCDKKTIQMYAEE